MNTQLTDEQRKKLRPALDKLDRAYEEFSVELRSVLGGEDGEPPFEGTSCFDCGCGQFVKSAHEGIDSCQREGCGHPERHHFLP